MGFWHFYPHLRGKSLRQDLKEEGYAAFRDNPHSSEMFYQHHVVSWSGLPQGHLNEEPVELLLVYKHAALSLDSWKRRVGKKRGRKRENERQRIFLRERRRRKWGQTEKGRFSLWHVSWWKDHFSPFLEIVFSSLPPSLPPSVCSSHYSLWCLPWHCWDGRNGHHNRNRPSPLPGYKPNSHRTYEASSFIQYMQRHVTLLVFLQWNYTSHGQVYPFKSELTQTGFLQQTTVPPI